MKEDVCALEVSKMFEDLYGKIVDIYPPIKLNPMYVCHKGFVVSKNGKTNNHIQIVGVESNVQKEISMKNIGSLKQQNIEFKHVDDKQ